MLYCDGIDTTKGLDLAKSSNSKEFMICHYWFLNDRFEFQDSVCNGCHNLTILSANIGVLSLSPLKVLFVVSLFIILVNLKQLIIKKFKTLKKNNLKYWIT